MTQLSLQAQIDALVESYGLHFADQPRLTRDVDLLAALLSELERLARTSGADPELLEELGGHLKSWRAERSAIETAQLRAGPEGCAAARLKLQVGAVMHRYIRHFAGQHRHSRDLGLLSEMIDTLRSLRPLVRHVEDLGKEGGAGSRSTRAARHVGQALEASVLQLEREHEEIVLAREARPDDPDISSQALRLAQAADTLHATYACLVIGRTRLTVRPELIARLAQSLSDLSESMHFLLKEGLRTEAHQHNCQVLAEHHTLWAEEHRACLQVRAKYDLEELAVVLGEEADSVLATYNETVAVRPASEDTRRVTLVLCDRMEELCGQLPDFMPGASPHIGQMRRQLMDIRGLLVRAYDHLVGRLDLPVGSSAP